MILSFIIILNALFTALNGEANAVPSDGGYIANGRFVISEGDLAVRITEEKGAWLTVGDNTELVIDGNVQLEGNGLSSCDIIRVTGSNVRIHGKGMIIGDRQTHKGKEGEWGTGIRLHGANDVTVDGLTIKSCWGDCIYIGGGSQSVKIDSCVLSDSRRQGISITKANGVTIRNCHIANISGTDPQYAIDIEPNRRCDVDNVLINHVDVKNCEGGIRATVPNAGVGNASIGRVEVRNCQVSAQSRYPIHLNRCKAAKVVGCIVDATNERPSIYANYVERLMVSNNTLNVDLQLLSSIKNKAKKLVGKSGYSAIRVVHGSANGVKNNRIIEK